ncbi:hypothetical protein QTU67_003400 [Vibrio cholerae]|uniref:hypothetical protein n=1 Tax=Vibrio cholerae TaxID=666 RepID=UPI00115A8C45|nr:hypothetical protein [Vibrio cholerae]EGR0666915.1 hypothetical protein [Vibrio cholerae]EJX7572450.1 hypothetical protein [Vibrio cholerae]ELP8149109.1 hypothetical protein [Vibrio cholerae]MDV2340932.1 hypothetical protein [Vibrio cholerae]TQP68472.1 hypothetical protein FLL76_00575 [Vibrio cholerae]
MIIRLLPDSPAVNAARQCQRKKATYQHNGQPCFVQSIKTIGQGQSERVEVTLNPIRAFQ